MSKKTKEFDVIFNDYLQFVKKNCAAPILTDKNLFLFLSTKSEVVDILKEKNIDVDAYKNFCEKEIKKEKKYNGDYEIADIYFNDKSNISGFIGKIFERNHNDATYLDFVEETAVAISKAYNNKDNNQIFSFSDEEELNKIVDFGFFIENINPEISKEIKELEYDFNDDNLMMLGEEILDNNIAEFSNPIEIQVLSEPKKKVIGFEQEVQKIRHVLSRKENATVFITGAKGVGKSACVDLLTDKLLANDIDFMDLNAWYRNDFKDDFEDDSDDGGYKEEFSNVEDVIEKAVESNRILIVDNLDAAVVKNVLSQLEKVNLKAVVVSDKLPKNAEFNGKVIKINSPKKEKTTQILLANKTKYENHHEIIVNQKIVEKIVEYSYQYIRNVAQPKASFELMDTAATFAQKTGKLTEANIVSALVEIYDVPEKTVKTDERAKLLSISNELSKNIIGQETAFEQIKANLVQQTIFPQQGKPKTSMLFAGSSGIGKTQCAKDLAELLGVEVLQYNMGEYSDGMSVSKFIGSGAGYIGSDKGGQVVKDIAANPNAIIIFDEIEKADPQIHRLMLGILDEASLKASDGQEARLDDNIIIFTSNVGFSSQDTREKVGFGSENKQIEVPSGKALLEKLSNHFPREFLGRVNDIITFNSLSNDNAKDIVKLNLDNIAKYFEQKYKVAIEFSENTNAQIVKNAISPSLGARNLKNYMNKKIKGEIARAYIAKEIISGQKVYFDYDSKTQKYALHNKSAKNIAVIKAMKGQAQKGSSFER